MRAGVIIIGLIASLALFGLGVCVGRETMRPPIQTLVVPEAETGNMQDTNIIVSSPEPPKQR
jgi:hypothetical protein